MAKYIDFEVIGAGMGDTAYDHQTAGGFNVTKMGIMLMEMLRETPKNATRQQFEALEKKYGIHLIKYSLEVESVKAANAQADVHEPTVASMTKEQGEKAVFLLELPDGDVVMADGNNRTRWLLNHGYKDGRAWLFKYPIAEQVRIHYRGKLPDGTWEDVSSEDALKMMMGKHHPINAGVRL